MQPPNNEGAIQTERRPMSDGELTREAPVQSSTGQRTASQRLPNTVIRPRTQSSSSPPQPTAGPSKPRGQATIAASISPLDVEAVRQYFTQDATDTMTSQRGENVRRILNRIDYTGRLQNVTRATQGGFSDVKKGQIWGTKIFVRALALLAANISAYQLAQVAIKTLREINMIPGDNNYDDTARNRLQKRMARELLRWFDLRHPHILPLVGFAFVDDVPCLLSIWCENGNVSQYLAAKPGANRKRLVRTPSHPRWRS